MFTLKRLGILDSRGQPVEAMMLACKVLQIELSELEPKTKDEFVQKQREK